MTLEQLMYRIAQYGIKKKLINYSAAGSSLYQLNTSTIKKYPVLFTSPTGSHTVNTDLTRFTLTLFYLDRLSTDNANDISIFSIAVEVLKDLIRGISEIEGIVAVSEEYTITNFTETERLNDKLAGAYTTIEIVVSNDYICEQD